MSHSQCAIDQSCAVARSTVQDYVRRAIAQIVSRSHPRPIKLYPFGSAQNVMIFELLTMAAIAAFDEALKLSLNQTLALQNRGVVMLKLEEQKTKASAAKQQTTDGKKQTAKGRK